MFQRKKNKSIPEIKKSDLFNKSQELLAQILGRLIALAVDETKKQFLEMLAKCAIKEQIKEQLIKNPPLPVKSSSKNTILMIHDKREKHIRDSAPMALLLALNNILELDKPSYHSPYFNCPINISNLKIVVTGTSEIPNESEFDDIKSKVIITKFPNFSPEQKRTIYKQKLKALLFAYKLKLNHDKKESIIIQALQSDQEHEITGISEGEKVLESAVQDIRISTFDHASSCTELNTSSDDEDNDED